MERRSKDGPVPSLPRKQAPHPDPLPASREREIEALLQLQRQAGNAAVSDLITKAPHPDPLPASREREKAPHPDPLPASREREKAPHPSPLPTSGEREIHVQRYQAGERGHGGIEAEALHQAGFGGDMTSGEIGAVYLGNWMRDWSQVGDPHNKNVLTLLNVMSMGEFNRPVSAEDVGGYLPSEHLDRPEGGGSVEDSTAKQMATSDWTGLSKEQQQWVRVEQNPMFTSYINERSAATDLPSYIETGKFHAKTKLVEAAQAGRDNPRGMAAMGNGLHAIEDYFSHSNFVDACVYTLVKEGKLAQDSKLYRDMVARTKQLGYDPFNPDPAWSKAHGGKVAIVSGSYRKDGNKAVSILEQIESEIKTGSLRKAAVLGAIRVGMVNAGAMGREAGAKAGKAVVGGLAAAGEAVGEAATGTAHGMAKGWHEGHGVGAVWDALKGGWAGGVEGGKHGAEWGWREGGDLGEREGGAAGQLVGEGIGAAVEAVAVGSVVALVSAAIESVRATWVLGVAAEHENEKLKKEKTDEATAADRKAGDPLPNHSQLAKDDTEHPLFGVSRDLAVEADRNIGTAMIEAWSAGADRDSVKKLMQLVDIYVSHPADNDWWLGPLMASIYGGVRAAR